MLRERIIRKIEHDVNEMDDDDEWCIRNGQVSTSSPGLILVSLSLSKERLNLTFVVAF